jgi:NADH-quinone oxidoreductase subunit L
MLALLVPALPLLSFLISFLISEKYSWLAPLISSLLLAATFIVAIQVFFQVDSTTGLSLAWKWFSIGEQTIQAGMHLDSVSLIMMVVVAFVSFLIHVYSIGYMADDPALKRYFAMLGFFTFSMLGLVMSGNLIITFCFWELVGFSSYRLIGHWQTKPAAAQAAVKAFLINKAGDLGFLVGLMFLWSASSLEVADYLSPVESTSGMTVAGICLFIGVMGKSAQFPLLHWLPDAMEGPTPVSALIHAATMVAAGAFLLVRISGLFTIDALMIISATGAITAIAGGLGALSQVDIKKILAYSTVSQLGFMVMAIGSGAGQGGFYHLLHHAFFKAGLFLGAGAVIHALHLHTTAGIRDGQDIRLMGGLRKKLPVTFYTFLICSLALAGIPFTSGFVSKEMVLTEMQAWAQAGSWRWMILAAAWLVTFLTPLYTFRVVWFVFIRPTDKEISVTEVPAIMRLPMLALAGVSLAIFIPWNPQHSVSLMNGLLNDYPKAKGMIFLFSLLVIVAAIGMGYRLFVKRPRETYYAGLSLHTYLDVITLRLVTLVKRMSEITGNLDKKVIDRLVHAIAYAHVTLAHLAGWADRWLVDGFVVGVAHATRGVGSLARSVVNGKIQSYLLWAMAGLTIFILWILY